MDTAEDPLLNFRSHGPLWPDALEHLQRSCVIADSLGHRWLDPVHVLLAHCEAFDVQMPWLIPVPPFPALLQSLGRMATAPPLQALLAPGAPSPVSRAHVLMRAAAAEARQRGNSFINVKHLFIVLLECQLIPIRDALSAVGFPVARVVHMVRASTGRGLRKEELLRNPKPRPLEVGDFPPEFRRRPIIRLLVSGEAELSPEQLVAHTDVQRALARQPVDEDELVAFRVEAIVRTLRRLRERPNRRAPSGGHDERTEPSEGDVS